MNTTLHKKRTGNIFIAVKRENGFTLIELVVAIVLMGVALPVIIGLFANVSLYASRGTVKDQMVAHAQNKMEEIVAVKEANWDWYKNPNQFVATENLTDNFQRSVTVTSISNWGNQGINGWEVTVSVSHPQMSNNYSLSVRFSKYHE